jgi:HSP20 family molecular chaperone IbpA
MDDARSGMAKEAGPEPSEARPSDFGFSAPEVTQTADEVVLKMRAPGLDPETLEHEIDGETLVVKARAASDAGGKINLNERLKLKGADLTQADVSYGDGQLVVRLPKAAFKVSASD